jgi:hypothetical protein
MDAYISLIVISTLFFVQIKKFKNMCKYLSFAYPDEWEKLTHSPMGGNHWSVINTNLNESLKSGFFSTLDDEKIKAFEKFRTYSLYIMGAVVVLQLVLAFLM